MDTQEQTKNQQEELAKAQQLIQDLNNNGLARYHNLAIGQDILSELKLIREALQEIAKHKNIVF